MIPSIGVCDGIAMGHIGMKYSLPSRELIADSVETCLLYTSVPEWDGATCAQCNKCSYVCPHATIRPYALTAEEAANAPVSYTHLDVYKRQPFCRRRARL